MMYTYTSSEHFHLEEKETMLARGNEHFRVPGENRTRDPPNTRSHVLTSALALVKSEFYYTSRVYYTSVLGAECIALLSSVSRLASSSFSKVIFNDVQVSSTLFAKRLGPLVCWCVDQKIE